MMSALCCCVYASLRFVSDKLNEFSKGEKLTGRSHGIQMSSLVCSYPHKPISLEKHPIHFLYLRVISLTHPPGVSICVFLQKRNLSLVRFYWTDSSILVGISMECDRIASYLKRRWYYQRHKVWVHPSIQQRPERRTSADCHGGAMRTGTECLYR